jgi:glucan phosphoethanolaminetransferase (alkaline phosphatase superfamily)
MGYRTHYFDGQRETFWLGTSYDPTYIDEWLTASQFSADTNERDSAIGKKVAEVVGSSVGNFIWINKRGVHYPYATKFPPSETHWRPSMSADDTRIVPGRREGLINSYDNALRYNLELFFHALDVPSWNEKVFVIYTSDHGQTLSERGERHTHCGTAMTTAPTEASVPLILITKAPVSLDTKFLASHTNIFPALLDLMGYPESERRYPYALSLLQATASQSQPRHFFVGSLNTRAALNARLLFDR